MFSISVLIFFGLCIAYGIATGYLDCRLIKRGWNGFALFPIFIVTPWLLTRVDLFVVGHVFPLTDTGGWALWFMTHLIILMYYLGGGGQWKKRLKKKASAVFQKFMDKVREATKPLGPPQPVPAG